MERYEKILTLGQLIEHSGKLKRLGVMDESTQVKLYQCWPQIAGESIAKNAKPIKVKKGQLVVAVRSPSWMQELSMRKPLLLQNLAKVLGNDSITDLRLVLSESDWIKG